MNDLIKVSPAEAMSLGKSFFESGMFADIKSAAQAVVKIMAGQELGIGAFAAMSGIHIIQGKPTIGAGLMAAKVKSSGKYDYKVLKQDDTACSIDFYQGKEKLGNSTFTADDAKKAGTQNMGKFPRNMLFARAISNGVKWYTPDIFTGPVYVPEEMNVITEDAQPQADGSFAAPSNESLPLPALTDKLYIKALGRIATGEDGVLEKLEKAFVVTDAQRKGLEEKIALVKQPVTDETTVA